MGVIDLNCNSSNNILFLWIPEGESHVCRQTRFFAGHGSLAPACISAMRVALPRRAVCEAVSLSRSVFRHGVCPTDSPRESARHQCLSSRSTEQTLPHGNSLRRRRAQHIVQSQRTPRLEHLRRLRSKPDPHRPSTLCRRGPGSRSRQHRLCARRLDDRSLPLGLSVGAVSVNQIGGQTPYTAGPARQYPDVYPYLRWQIARRQRPRYPAAGAGRLLHHGPGLCGLRTAFHPAHGGCFLRHPGQVQYPATVAATRDR